MTDFAEDLARARASLEANLRGVTSAFDRTESAFTFLAKANQMASDYLVGVQDYLPALETRIPHPSVPNTGAEWPSLLEEWKQSGVLQKLQEGNHD
jgi:hypothetical protein